MIRSRIIASVVLVFLIISTATPAASAHILKTDGTIGAVLHIEPDDNPTSGTPISYVLSFKDTAARFKFSNCDCNLRITADGQTTTTQALSATYDLDSEGSYTFPKPAVYLLTVTGKPRSEGSFQSFTLAYTVRVESGTVQNSTRKTPPMLYLGVNLLCALILLAFYKIIYNRKPKGGNAC